MRPKLFTLAVATVLLFAACSKLLEPIAVGRRVGPRRERPGRQRRRRRAARPRELGSIGDHRHGHPVRLAVVAGRGQCPDPDAARLPGRLSQRQGRLPAARRRLRGRSWPPSSPRATSPTSSTSTPTTRQQWIDQGFLRRSTTTSPSRASTPASSSRATPRSSRARTARPTACPRTATRSPWPTTRTSSRPPPKTHGRARHRRQGAQGQGRPQGAAVPEPGPRPRPRVPLRPGRLAATDDGTDRGDRHATRRRRPSSGTWTCSRTASA